MSLYSDHIGIFHLNSLKVTLHVKGMKLKRVLDLLEYFIVYSGRVTCSILWIFDSFCCD